MKRILTHSVLNSAEKFPEKIAFTQAKTDISYASLISQSNKLANFLESIGVRKGDRVGICMNRSIESAYSVYGIMMCGAIYVPIDSRLPEHRIGEIIADCDMKLVLSQPQFKVKITKIAQAIPTLKHIIGLDNLEGLNEVKVFSWVDVFSTPDIKPQTAISEFDPAYIIYTSGTTGKPKGIVHTHYSGFSYAKLSAELYDLSSTDILGNHSHLHYDISTMGYLTMPYVGGCTVIIPEAHTIFPVNLAQLIEEKKMTIWYSVPLALIQLLQTNVLDQHDYGALRWVLFGGESFSKKYIDELYAFMPQVKFSNVYGPAEVNQCTFFNFDATDSIPNPIPLGKAWAETDLKIDHTSSDEKSGELLVSSSTQMKGYWNKEELNNECFVELKDDAGVHKRYYKTGDIVKIASNNDLVFAGRSDRQIKLRGHRVELNEIENTILGIKDVDAVAVYAKKEKDDQSVIYSNIVLYENTITAIEIKKIISKLLPPQAMPSEIRIVDSIPRTAAGKVDYKSLTK